MDGALDPLKDASLLDVEINFDDGAYKYIPEEQFAKENSDWEQIKKEMNLPKMKVVATGGFGRLFATEIECIDAYDSALTLKGIRLIALKNKAPKKLERHD